jgi:hypothetical protein
MLLTQCAGAARGFSPGFGAAIYHPRTFDIQILNSLVFFCLAGFLVRFAQIFLSKFSSKFDLE